jgi:hypothetical protein
MWGRLLLGLPIMFALGCGSSLPFAPVSGKVTMNGQPLANATVNFQPIAPQGKMEVAPGSAGATDEKGEYHLQGATGQDGAWVGKHRVMISLVTTKAGAAEGPTERGGPPQENKIPARYNDKTELTFEVPSGGSTKADFALKSP